MIKKYSDHAANERTYLSWIRTSIAIMAFGFLIEKFELYIVYVGQAIGDEKNFQPSLSAELVGLSLFLVGVLIITTSTIRFFMHKEAIESDDTIPYSIRTSNILLSALVIFLAIFLFFYMANQIFN